MAYDSIDSQSENDDRDFRIEDNQGWFTTNLHIVDGDIILNDIERRISGNNLLDSDIELLDQIICCCECQVFQNQKLDNKHEYKNLYYE